MVLLIKIIIGVAMMQDAGYDDTQMMESNPVLNRMEYMQSVANEYSTLIPSIVIIDDFLTVALRLDTIGTVFSLKHSKRVSIANKVKRTALLETRYGEARSAITCRKANNHFGTKYNKRITPRSTGEERLRIATYKQWTDGYLDMIEYIIKYGRSWIR